MFFKRRIRFLFKDQNGKVYSQITLAKRLRKLGHDEITISNMLSDLVWGHVVHIDGMTLSK